MVGIWEPTVAKLPDLTKMITRTYVNEVDIQKVKTGQQVNVSLDAFPSKVLHGKVTQVANVGEQNPRSDAKVFEVVIEMLERDTLLKPSMTTGNNIIVGRVPGVLSVPLECVHHQGDSLAYVYKKTGLRFVKQEVQTAQANDNFIIIKKGVEEGDEVYLNPPTEDKEAPVQRISSTVKPRK
jgi:multidrug efflux pump subunit AcrA (membrane-fusion protein)